MYFEILVFILKLFISIFIVSWVSLAHSAGRPHDANFSRPQNGASQNSLENSKTLWEPRGTESIHDIGVEDGAFWLRTLFPEPDVYERLHLSQKIKDEEFQKLFFMRRTFLMLAALGISYTPRANDREFLKPWPYPLATALSHGQRILIEGVNVSSQQVLNLLTGTHSKGLPKYIYTRTFASHGTVWNKKLNQFDEVKLKGGKGALKQAGQMIGRGVGKRYHLGIDLAAGGLGYENYLGDLIGPGGTFLNPHTLKPKKGRQHGHIYINPSDIKTGRQSIMSAILMGVEVESPGRRGMYGNKHDLSSGFRSSIGEASLWGSVKMQKLPVDPAAKPAMYGGMFVAVHPRDLLNLKIICDDIFSLPEEDQYALFSDILRASHAKKSRDILRRALEEIGSRAKI